MAFSLPGKRIWVAGHRGMVGSAIVRRLATEDCEIMTVSRDVLDLLDQAAVRRWVADTQPDGVVMAAARVGGIFANDTYPASFLYENLVIETNVIDAAFRAGVQKLMMLGSSCIYPKMAPQPIPESAILTGPLESTNQWYAIAKIAGIMLCQAYRRQYGTDYISVMPTNLYGPGDNFDLQSSHVVPALLRKAHEAKRGGDSSITIWGSGRPRREFLHVDDCADALIFLLKSYSGEEFVNVGYGKDVTIMELAGIICDVVGYSGTIQIDNSKPDGTPRKLMSDSRLRELGWRPRIGLREGITQTYHHFLNHSGASRGVDMPRGD